MEKIRVNMTPCEEVKTIHASQNDIATRKWAFDLYDENGKIDSSDIKEQMIFDSKVGGTEQILPENTSDPTTSPIIADIQYPDSLRGEQTFLYRESPTQEDGQAKITKIKGNTVVFNQLVQNGNFVDTSNWEAIYGSMSVSSNVLTYTPTTIAQNFWDNRVQQEMSCPANHNFYVTAEIKPTKNLDMMFYFDATTGYYNQRSVEANKWTKVTWKYVIPNAIVRLRIIFNMQNGTGWATSDNVQLRNVMFVDLTKMGLDTLTVDQFTSLYPLPYYAYTQGKLLPFKGEELKTTNADETETNVLSLPTLTYFPSGMKSAGSVYDEITESKAITRIGSIVLDGTQSIMGSNFSSTQCRIFIEVPNAKPFTDSDSVDNGIISSYLQSTSNVNTYNGGVGVHRRITGASQICISLGSAGYASGITTEALFSQYLASHPLTVYYELETPTEEPISSQTQLQNQALSTILGKTVSVDSPEEPLNILLKGE